MNLIFKRARFYALFALLTLLALSPVTQAQAKPGTVRIVLKGLVCAYCAHGLSQRLTQRSEIESVQVHLASRDAILKFKPLHALSESELRQVALDAGLQIERIEYPTE